ncbi:putative transporter [Trachipleistophora hominis]|uniref:Putative transporter n=1 Tax=Trachipleistophora hominis TaxID=72359 RepID=L7JVW7_TRAHO|nr:putative transporter [Trachipleistophora hominis]
MHLRTKKISIYNMSSGWDKATLLKFMLPIMLLASLTMCVIATIWGDLHTNKLFETTFIVVSIATFAYIIFVEVEKYILGTNKTNKDSVNAFLMYGLIIIATVAVIYTFINCYEQLPLLPAFGFLLTNVTGIFTGSPGGISLMVNIALLLLCGFAAFVQAKTSYEITGTLSFLIVVAFGIKSVFFKSTDDDKKKKDEGVLKYLTLVIALIAAVLFMYTLVNSELYYDALFSQKDAVSN